MLHELQIKISGDVHLVISNMIPAIIKNKNWLFVESMFISCISLLQRPCNGDRVLNTRPSDWHSLQGTKCGFEWRDMKNKVNGSVVVRGDNINEKRIDHFTAPTALPAWCTGERLKKWGYLQNVRLPQAEARGCAPFEGFVAACERKTNACTNHPPHRCVE
jgi:hypothetical protein